MECGFLEINKKHIKACDNLISIDYILLFATDSAPDNASANDTLADNVGQETEVHLISHCVYETWVLDE